MKPYIHAKNSVNKYGGKIEDYIELHNFMDSSKAHFPDARHRVIFHSSFGIFIVEKVFGITLTNSDGKILQVRDLAEDHILEDIGFIPTVADYLRDMPHYEWLNGDNRTRQMIDKQTEKIDEVEVPIDDVQPTPEQRDENLFEKMKEWVEEQNKKNNPFGVPSIPYEPYPWTGPRRWNDTYPWPNGGGVFD